MGTAIVWSGFFGSWLLVAGPIFQAALELQQEDVQRDQIVAAGTAAKDHHPPVSPWWWLLPPVAYWLRRRRSRRFRREVLQTLTAEQRAGLIGFVNKATGWFFVAGGAALIALKETWELVEHEHWPHVIFWVLIVVMALLSFGNTAVRMGLTRQVVGAR
ncbi:hypothetical protein [Pseudonocardia sp. TRM90224]|uniref:hypothetical protein n=1 Tax=Pseudonocardia sp. TRM90224 TaxID=2812678 RepID=UPI001E5F86C9|nr:hypothetical protein [Pseudonocardia sp. TRM90224]